MTNPLPDWYVKRYPHAVRPEGPQVRRAGAVLYAGHVDYGTRRTVTRERTFSFTEFMTILEGQAQREREHRAAPWVLRLELWWMRLRLRRAARPGFRLTVEVATA